MKEAFFPPLAGDTVPVDSNYVQVGGALPINSQPHTISNCYMAYGAADLRRIEEKLDILIKLLTDESGNPRHSSQWCWND